MKSLVIYDSFFGNTQKIALAICSDWSAQKDVLALRVGDVRVEQLCHLDLLVVGSPTRAFNPTKAISSLLKTIPDNALKNTKVAAFDTRISPTDVDSRMYSFLEKRFGYAADPIAKILQKKGGNLIVQPEGFCVTDSEGPLKDGELKRAGDWGKQIFIKGLEGR